MGKGLVKFFLDCSASIKRTLFPHLPLYVCLVLFSAISVGVTAAYHVPLVLGSSLLFLEAVPPYFLTGMLFAAAVQYVRLALAGSKRPVRDFGAWVYRSTVSDDRVGNMFHTLLTIPALMVSFNALKQIVPLIQPFSWDPAFVKWDRVLGFGYMPWELIQLVLGHPPITAAISIAYAFWFFFMSAVLIWQAFFARADILRMQFLLAFALAWFIGGNVLAVIFSSAGPCYYGYLYGSDPFAAQMAYLRGASENWPIWSVHIQDLLWESYAGGVAPNFGISAMPSMHVVVATLMAIVGLRTNKWLGAGLTAFAGVIVIGSVHLGWHYAVDSVAGVGLAVLFWSSAGLILRWQARAGGTNWVTAVPASGEAPA